MELVDIKDPASKWKKTVELAQLCEQLGYDSIWVYDHFHNVPRPAGETVFECWSLISALSQVTSRIRLGQMVSCNSYRSPGLVAKITSTIDVISGGRLDFGIGAGWYEHEYRGYGFEFREAKDRLGMLRESVEIIRSMWTQPRTTYEGKYYSLEGAYCDPKPLQKPTPPIWIGGGGEKVTLKIVAQHADYSNFGGKPDEWERKAQILERHCDKVGRDYSRIAKTWSPELFMRSTRAELERDWKGNLWGEPWESYVRGNVVGTPEMVSEQIQSYIDLGCSGFVMWPNDLPDATSVQLFAEEVIPNFR